MMWMLSGSHILISISVLRCCQTIHLLRSVLVARAGSDFLSTPREWAALKCVTNRQVILLIWIPVSTSVGLVGIGNWSIGFVKKGMAAHFVVTIEFCMMRRATVHGGI